MGFSKAVQFRGIKNVVKAYTNKKVAPWGLFQGTQFLEKYEGDDVEEGSTLLRDYLEALDQRSNDMNTYTLCLYEDPASGKINSSTKFDASFNFRLADTIEDHVNSKMAGAYESRIAGLEDRINELSAPETAEETPQEKMWNALGKILEHPQVQQVIAQRVVGFIDGLSGTLGNIFSPRPYPAAIGNTMTTNKTDTTAADENAKLQQAVNILVTVDDKLGTHLLKLAEYAKADPAKYLNLISMLNLL
jgi:hypothetical protein